MFSYMNGITISEMVKELGIDKNAVAQRLFVAKIKPITKEAVYHESALEAIRNVPGKGRPKKQPEGVTAFKLNDAGEEI
jgi:hypothetical protein